MSISSVSTFKANTLSYTWTLENFLEYYKCHGLDSESLKDSTYSRYISSEEYLDTWLNVDYLDDRQNDFFESEKIKNDHLEIFLEIFPFKSFVRDSNYFEACVALRVNYKHIGTEMEKGYSNFKVSLLGDDNIKLLTRAEQIKEISSDFNDVKVELIPYRNLFKNPGKYLSNNNLKIECEIKYNFQYEVNNCKVVDVETKQLHNFSNVWNSRKFTDVTLVVKIDENQTKDIKAHKLILADRAEYFSQMFKNPNWSEAKEGRIEITDFEANVVETALHFMYTGNVKLVAGLKEKLLAIANKWGLESLKLLCEQSLCTKISDSTITDLIALADIHNAQILKSKALDYFKNQVDLKNVDGRLLAELIRSFAQKRTADEIQSEEAAEDDAKKSKN